MVKCKEIKDRIPGYICDSLVVIVRCNWFQIGHLVCFGGRNVIFKMPYFSSSGWVTEDFTDLLMQR